MPSADPTPPPRPDGTRPPPAAPEAGARPETPAAPRPAGSAAEVFAAFLRLGLTSFGGPVAHLGYFREALVRRRGWVDEAAYAELVALCQFLPGPASSQVGLALGMLRAGLPGALAAWAAFTLPSALALAAFAAGVGALDAAGAGWLAGVKAAAVAVVAQAALGMGRTLAPDRARQALAAAAAALALLAPGVAGQLGAIAVGALAGLAAGRGWAAPPAEPEAGALPAPLSRAAGAACLVLAALLLALLPLAAGLGPLAAHADAFYRAGALVFGGGHVVLPLLEAETVGRGWLDAETFVAGYGAAQAVPGPLFAFAAFLGQASGGAGAAAVSLVAIFLPGAVLAIGVLPFWAGLRARPGARAALAGVNAAVVGLLLAALYDPVFARGAAEPAGFVIALAAWLALGPWRISPPLVVLGAAGLGQAAGWAGLLG
ncbi:chromate efflux transporter [Albimonas sp. CAU 1670]|uniref:chromate efflux transporter n=1 Tax=Albimonas sp. CAU 1670 TaxID=3032599 RepID=UPI0023DB35E3|nr:chromate efflux transporter [Albimonas sp. CAU 1670]MDF2231563.1 chromate efflux transporter [Albimonas sp. CAU 1670]